MATFNRKTDLGRARVNPAAVFTSPEAVVATAELRVEEKIELLRRWAYAAGETVVAEDEGMGAGEPSLKERILVALDRLEAARG